MASFAAASTPSRSADGSRFGEAAGARVRDGLVDRAARVASMLRQHGVGRAVQDRDDARDPIAGETVAERAHDRHRAADRRLEPQLAALPLGQRQQRRHRGARSTCLFAVTTDLPASSAART